MEKKLKQISITGLFYRFSERILAQVVSTIVTIVLARILVPEDYGVVALISVFITICNVFVTDGLSSSLVQKKESDQLDFSSIFWAGLVLAILIYSIVFFLSPYIAQYFDNQQIVMILRIMALRIPLAAVNSVQSAYVSKHLLFKEFFFATLTGTIISGIVGIIVALLGLGAWALVIQYLLNSFIDTVFLFMRIKWKPSLVFSFSRFKTLFAFGWKVLISGVVGEIYEELRSVVIAKKYTTVDLSYYTKGKQFPQLIGDNVSSTITNVMFPVFSKIQDNPTMLKNAVRRSIKSACFILCPLMIGFATVSEQFVRIVLTDKWLECVPFIQLFCIMYIFKPLKNINKCAMKALHRSDLDLAVNIIEKVIGISLLLLFMNRGTYSLAISAIVTYIIATTLNMVVNGHLLGYRLLEQVADTMLYFILAILACVPAMLMSSLAMSEVLKVLLQITISVIVYVLTAKLLKLDIYEYLLNLLMKTLKPKKK